MTSRSYLQYNIPPMMHYLTHLYLYCKPALHILAARDSINACTREHMIYEVVPWCTLHTAGHLHALHGQNHLLGMVLHTVVPTIKLQFETTAALVDHPLLDIGRKINGFKAKVSQDLCSSDIDRTEKASA